MLGHEGAGIVESRGRPVRSVKPGDHVVIATLASCGTCRACNTGHPTRCIRSLGNVSTPFTYDGEPASNFAAASVFAEHTIVQEVQAVRISKDVPLHLGVPHRLRRPHRRGLGAQPGQGVHRARPPRCSGSGAWA